MARVDVLALIVDALSPDLGPVMAGASVRGIAARLGLSDMLSPSDVERLLAALEPGLAVFVGHRGAARSLSEIRDRLKAAGAL